jgi:hypothetical protein
VIFHPTRKRLQVYRVVAKGFYDLAILIPCYTGNDLDRANIHSCCMWMNTTHSTEWMRFFNSFGPFTFLSQLILLYA